MKYIIVSLFLVSNVYAEEACHKVEEVLETKDVNTPTPESMKGSKILIKKPDGSVEERSIEEFKVVPRKQQFVVSKVKESIDCSHKQAATKKNRISLVGGVGPGGSVDKFVSPNLARIETNTSLNVGLQYQRLITERFSLGVQGLSNRSFEGMLGFDF